MLSRALYGVGMQLEELSADVTFGVSFIFDHF